MSKDVVALVERYRSKNYEIGYEMPDNRDPDELRAHIKAVAEEMKEHGFFWERPILLGPVRAKDGKRPIYDGQSRLRAAKLLGIEFVYEIVEEMSRKKLIALQVSRTWDTKAYIRGHVYHDIGPIKALKELHSRYNRCTIGNIGAVMEGNFSNGGTPTERIKSGDLRVTHIDLAERTLATIQRINEAHIPGQFKDFYWTRPGLKALMALHNDGRFDPNKLIAKMETHHGKLLIFKDIRNVWNNLCAIYNMSSRKPIIFEAPIGMPKH